MKLSQGMIPKIKACLDAINNGVTAVGLSMEQKNTHVYGKYFLIKDQVH